MKHLRCLFVFSLILVSSMPAWAQHLIIEKEFKEIPNSSVLALYKNEFGKWNKPDLDDPFPYVVIRMDLSGNAREVMDAKKYIGLYMGRMTGVEAVCTDYDNQILFLIPSRARYVVITCGDGCQQQIMFENPKLRSNAVYAGRVHYVPEGQIVAEEDLIVKRTFTFEVKPANAEIEMIVHGEKRNYTLQDGKVEIELDEGLYFYSVAADGYHDEEGTIKVSAKETSKVIRLLPKFGWLTVDTVASTRDDFLTMSNIATRQITTLTIPIVQQPVESGTYEVMMRKPRYYDYIDTIVIRDGEYLKITPTLNLDDRMVMKTFVLGQVGYSMTSSWTYGAMIGQTYNGIGWFVQGRSDFQKNMSSSKLQCDKQGVIDEVLPFYNGKTASAAWQVTAGLVLDILELSIKPDHYFDTFGFYLGGGYGTYTHSWQLTSGEWVSYGPTFRNGFCGSVGVIGSVHGFTLKAGVSSINFKSLDIEMGIGWMF